MCVMDCVMSCFSDCGAKKESEELSLYPGEPGKWDMLSNITSVFSEVLQPYLYYMSNSRAAHHRHFLIHIPRFLFFVFSSGQSACSFKCRTQCRQIADCQLSRRLITPTSVWKASMSDVFSSAAVGALVWVWVCLSGGRLWFVLKLVASDFLFLWYSFTLCHLSSILNSAR